MRQVALFLLLILLAACAPVATRIQGTGQAAAPPPGWIDYCFRHPSDPACKEWQQ